MTFSRFTLVLIVGLCALLGAAAPTTAASGGLKVMVTGNCNVAGTDLPAAIKAQPGIASVTTFDTSAGTPTAAQLSAADLVVDLGNECAEYLDAATYGNRLADYVDHGGVVLQMAYDNWDVAGAYPLGRFASDGYPPLSLGPSANSSTTLGQVLKPSSPIVKGLGTFATHTNTTTALAKGATLLAKWADGRNAIAVKGRVVATSANGADTNDVADLARLARNTVTYFDAPPGTKITKATIGAHSAAFRFKAIGFATGFKCELKKRGKNATFKACPFQKKYVGLKKGKYTFEVAAVGRGGADPTPAKKSFKIPG